MSDDIVNNYECTKDDLRKKILSQKKEIERLKFENLDLKNKKETEITELKNEINKLLNSKSWKITKPLRRITNIKNRSYKETKKIENDIIVYENSYKKYPIYTSNYQENINYSEYTTDIKLLAFYLPQFYTFKENDLWWGKGFTEWTNTRKSKPRFEGHYQPRTPHLDIGYYTLDNINTIKKQIDLAKQHGIYGFCYYYYWFSGKRLLDKPLDLFLKNNIDFPFCLCWANENWTRKWDGQQQDILIKQNYDSKDYKNFIKDIKKYVTDKRYIKIDNKPVIMVYNPKEILNFEKLVEKWRKYAKELGIGEIYVMSKNDLANDTFENCDFVDAEFDFPPQGIGHQESVITGLSSPKIFNYEKIVHDIEPLYRKHFPLKPFYYSCTMGWDNSCRRKENYTVYYNYSLNSYYKWLKIIIEETRKRNNSDRRFVFVNAWNEWAEGTYLEPDQKYGYANINTLSKAIFDLELNITKKSNNIIRKK